MNPFDPALEKNVGNLVALVRDASHQCHAVPSVGHAIGHVSVAVHCFYRELRDEFLRKVLAGEGPNAKILKMVHSRNHIGTGVYSWDLIKQVKRQPLRKHPPAAFHKAFCDYVSWTQRLANVTPIGPNDTPFIIRWHRIGLVKMGFPVRPTVYTQGHQTGEVHLTYSVPDLEVTEIAIKSDLEEIPLLKQLGQGTGELEMDFDLDYDRFWRHYYCKDVVTWEQEYPDLMFPKVVGGEQLEDIVIKLRNFVVLSEENDEIRMVDGVITLVAESWKPCGYSVKVCNQVAALFHGIRGESVVDWRDLPRPLQVVLHQIQLVSGRQLGVELTNPSLHTFKATVVSRLPLDESATI